MSAIIKNPLTVINRFEDLNEIISEQERLINELSEALEDRGKKKEYFLTFSSESTFNWGLLGGDALTGTIEYSTDKENWHIYNWSYEGAVINSSSDGKLYIRGTGNTTTNYNVCDLSPTDGTSSDDFRFDCTGNIETLLDYKTVARGEHPIMDAYCYANMFSGTRISTAPELPATQLSEGCYQVMFQNCRYLEKAPELPATTLANSCYYGMFGNCVSLTIVPKLPATILDAHCYNGMFLGCYNLSSVPNLPATELKMGCYNDMFAYCTNIKLGNYISGNPFYNNYSVPKNGTITVDEGSGFQTMFSYTSGSITTNFQLNTIYSTTNIVK